MSLVKLRVHGAELFLSGKTFATPFPAALVRRTACFVVRDRDGQKLAYVYFEDEPGRQAAAKQLSKDEARRNRGQRGEVAGTTEKALN